MARTAQRQSRPYAARMAPDQRREQLLDAVLRVIVRDGVHRVSIDAVAKEAGVTRPVVYTHFSDSDELLRASLSREEAAALDQMAAILPDLDQDKPAAAILGSLEGFLRVVSEAPGRWQAIFTLADSSTPAFRARLEAGRAAVLTALEELIQREILQGDLASQTDVGMLARTIYALFWDAGRLTLAEPDQFPRERILAFAALAAERYLQQPRR